MRQVIILLLVFSLLFTSVASTPYYGDMVFTVSQDGSTAIEGISNYPLFALSPTTTLVTQKDAYYLFNLTITDELFSDFVYELHLPEGAVINYIKTPEFNRIEHTDKGIILVGSAEDKYVKLLVQYSFTKKKKSLVDSPWILLGFALMLFASWFYGRKKPTIKKTNAPSKEITVALTIRQQTIVDLLAKNGAMTQAALEKATGFPKSSLSRNIDALVRKDVVQKLHQGMTNKIQLK